MIQRSSLRFSMGPPASYRPADLLLFSLSNLISRPKLLMWLLGRGAWGWGSPCVPVFFLSTLHKFMGPPYAA